MRRLLVVIAVMAAACSSATVSTTTAVQSVTCEQPPLQELEAESNLGLSVDPNPAFPRQTVTLTVSSRGLPDDALAGVDARWQCWSGAEWVTTHAVYRGFGDIPGQTIPLNSEFQIRVPSIGLALDEGFPIVIPQVDPGAYRISDEVIVEGEAVPGFVIVDVEGRG